MNKITVPVTLPADVWGALATRADQQGKTVADLLAGAITDLTRPRFKRGPVEGSRLADDRWAVIKPLRDAGWTWPQIVARTGIPMSSAMQIAKRHGITRTKGNAS